MTKVAFDKGLETNLPTSGMASEGHVYVTTDKGNAYLGLANGTLLPFNRSPYYGSCSTAGNTNSKVVTLDVENDNFIMQSGVAIIVKFANKNTSASPTLNVNGKGAVAVKSHGNTSLPSEPCAWKAGESVMFVYDGTYWLMLGAKTQADWNQADSSERDYIKNKPTIPTLTSQLTNDSNLSYENYGVCSSSAGTVAKTVTVNNANFALSSGVTVYVKFTSQNVSLNPTLSVNGTTATPIVTRGTNAVGRGTSCSWNSGSVVELTYDGTSWVITGFLNDNDVYHAAGNNVVIEDLDPFEKYDSLLSLYNSSNTSFSTGKVPSNQNEVFIDIRYYERSSLTNFYLFGFCGGTAAQYRWGIMQPTNTSTSKFQLCWRDKGNAYLESTIARVASHIYRIKASLTNGTATLYVLDETTGVSDTVSTTYDITNVNSLTSNIRLFAGGSSNYYCGNGTYVYFVRMECDSKPFVNYLPMVRKSDSEVGFLNTVSGTFLSSASGNVSANKLNTGSYLDRPNNHVIKVSTTVDDSNFVHKTGNETVGGEKTFTDNICVGNGKSIVFDLGNDEGAYVQASQDTNGKVLSLGDTDDDSEIRLANVAQPINNLDAANKAYVDAAVTGGSSGITLPLAIDEGGTGSTTAKGAEYALTTNLGSELTSDIGDTYRVPFLHSSPSSSNGRFVGWRKASKIWDYIFSKITSILGISYNTNNEGVPLAPTAASGTNTTQIATTAFVQGAVAGLAIDNNVVHKAMQEHILGYKYFDSGFESVYIKRTNGTSSQFLKADGSVDSNAYITSDALPSPSNVTPSVDGNASIGTSTDYARADHVHPIDISRAADTAVVHNTGNESIGGTKTFTDDIVLSNGNTFVFGTTQDNGVYLEANTNGSSQALTFAAIDDDSAVRLENIAAPTNLSDAVNKEYVDNAMDNNYVFINGVIDSYGVQQKSLCAFGIFGYPSSMVMTSFTTSGGTGSKNPYYSRCFPIGCKIYYHDGDSVVTGSFTSKKFYTTHKNVDARYSSVTGSISLLNNSSVYLRVSIVNGIYWQPYYKSGETNEIIVCSNFVSGGFYIYLGKAVGSNGYTFQLEDNNQLYCCIVDENGTHLIDWASYKSSASSLVYQSGEGIEISNNVISATPRKIWNSVFPSGVTTYFNSTKKVVISSASPNQMSKVGLYRIVTNFVLHGGANGTYGTGATSATIALGAYKNGSATMTNLKSVFLSNLNLTPVYNVHLEDYVYLGSGTLIPCVVIAPDNNGYVCVGNANLSGTNYTENPTISVEYIGIDDVISANPQII